MSLIQYVITSALAGESGVVSWIGEGMSVQTLASHVLKEKRAGRSCCRGRRRTRGGRSDVGAIQVRSPKGPGEPHNTSKTHPFWGPYFGVF